MNNVLNQVISKKKYLRYIKISKKNTANNVVQIYLVMKEVKNCPCCGEEILAVAKKCKHCGEWLEKEAVTKQKKMLECLACAEQVEDGLQICPHCNESVGITSKHNAYEASLPYGLPKQVYLFLMLVAIIAIVFEFIGIIGAVGRDAGQPAPPVDYFVSGLFWTYLMLGLRKHYVTMQIAKPLPFIVLIIFGIALYLLSILYTVEYNAFRPDLDILETILIFYFLILIPVIIFYFVIGNQLSRRKDSSKVGLMFIIYPIIIIIATIATIIGDLFYFDYSHIVGDVIEHMLGIVFYIILFSFFRNQRSNQLR